MKEINHFQLSSQECALVVIDVQERLATAMKKKDPVIENCLHLIALAGLSDIPVLLTEQYPKGLGPTVPELLKVVPEVAAEKTTFSCCGVDDFNRKIESSGRQKIVLTGMETHVCVLMTALDLLERGYVVHVVSDAVCSRRKANWISGLALLKDAGAVITNTETVLFQILERAGSDAFKTISKRIR